MLQIKLYGLGGQGVVTAAKVLAVAAGMYEGRYARSIPAYGHERRGAPVFADLFLAGEPVRVQSFVWRPDYVLVFDPSVKDKGVDYTAGATAATRYIVNGAVPPGDPPPAGRTFYVDARGIALAVMGRDIPNGAMLGALAATGVVGLAAVEAALLATFAGGAGDLNALCARRAYESVRGGDGAPLAGTGGRRV